MVTAAEEQLRLEIGPAESASVLSPAADLVGAMLEAYRGDYRAAMEALMADADFLRDQLHTASCLMSSGLTRGWKPKYERVPS